MGTRGMNMIYVNGEYKCSNYNQWDSYPKIQGLTALKFLRDEMNYKNFKDKVLQCSWISEDQYNQLWIECGSEPESDSVDLDVDNKFKEKYYYLHRDCGAKIYKLIEESECGLKLEQYIDFCVNYSCQWAYVVDLDKNTFEIYKSNDNEKLNKDDRFYFLQDSDDNLPIKMIKQYSLFNLPSDEDFLKQCTK